MVGTGRGESALGIGHWTDKGRREDTLLSTRTPPSRHSALIRWSTVQFPLASRLAFFPLSPPSYSVLAPALFAPPAPALALLYSPPSPPDLSLFSPSPSFFPAILPHSLDNNLVVVVLRFSPSLLIFRELVLSFLSLKKSRYLCHPNTASQVTFAVRFTLPPVHTIIGFWLHSCAVASFI
jgi:hypothetical protein